MKLLKYSLLFLALFLGQNSIAQEDQKCEISEVYFDYPGELNEDTDVTLTVKPENQTCAEQEKSFTVQIMEAELGQDTIIYSNTFSFNTSGEDLTLTFKPGNEGCYNESNCQFYVNAIIKHSTYRKSSGKRSSIAKTETITHSSSPESGELDGIFKNAEQDIIQKARLEFKPRSTEVVFERGELSGVDECTLQSIGWKTDNPINPDNFIDSKEKVNLEIKTTNCIGQEIVVLVDEIDTYFDDESALTNQVTVSEDLITITYQPGDDQCDSEDTPDCNFAAKAKIILSTAKSCSKNSSKKCNISIETGERDQLKYNCHIGEIKTKRKNKTITTVGPACNIPWNTESTIGLEKIPQNFGTTTPKFDPNSPCIVDKDDTSQGYKENCYELLANIPGIGKTDESTGRSFISNIKSYSLGTYVNQLFQISLGILMVLAVIMIVIAGVQYMTVESIYGKSDAKKNIIGAVTGLILSLGIFIILNTINPRLLEIDFGSNIQEVGIETIELSDAQIDFAANIDISGIQISDDLYTYEPLITYIYHQQGIGGGPSILWAAKNNLAALPSRTPFIKSQDASGINAKMAGNVSPKGTQVTPKEFLQFWYLRLKQKEKEINSISQNNPEHAKAIQTASNLTGVDVNILKTVCMVESYDCTDANAVNGSYSGLFQMGKDEFAKNGPANGNIFDPGDNSLAAARLAKNNLRAHQRNLKRINSGLDF